MSPGPNASAGLHWPIKSTQDDLHERVTVVPDERPTEPAPPFEPGADGMYADENCPPTLRDAGAGRTDQDA